MGTRSLIVVYDQQGKHRIAQYSQWDGYPAGQGKTVLEFLKDEGAVRMLRNYRLDGCRFLTEAEIEKIGLEKNPIEQRPQLSRNLGADILHLAATVDKLALVDSIQFAADSLFCEWAYVISFKDNVFEVYKGFNKLEPEGRFKDFKTEDDSEYRPVTLIKTYDIGNLPSLGQFVKDCDPGE